MPYATNAIEDDAIQTGQVAVQGPRGHDHYGVAVRDIFSDSGWAPAEPVRARSWHDIGARHAIGASETTFD